MPRWHFCQSLPDLLMEHHKPSLIRSVHKPPKALQGFLPVKAGIKANVSAWTGTWRKKPVQDGTSQTEAQLTITSNKWKQKSFSPLGAIYFHKTWSLILNCSESQSDPHFNACKMINISWEQGIILSFRKHSNVRKVDGETSKKGIDVVIASSF